MKTPTTRTLKRQGNRTKAALVAGAGVAVLLGGSSTFAMWAQETSVGRETRPEAVAIQNGDGTFDLTDAIGTTVSWFDTHPAVVDAKGAYKPASQLDEDGVHIGTDDREYTGVTLSEFAGDAGSVNGRYDGTQIDGIADVRFVPGDSLLGIYTVNHTVKGSDPGDAVMTGAHVRAKVTVKGTPLTKPQDREITDGNETSEYTFTSHRAEYDDSGKVTGGSDALSNTDKTDEINVDVFTAVDDGWQWLGDNRVAVYIEYEANWDEGIDGNGDESLAKAQGDWLSDRNAVSTLDMKIFSNMTIKVVQVPEMEDFDNFEEDADAAKAYFDKDAAP